MQGVGAVCLRCRRVLEQVSEAEPLLLAFVQLPLAPGLGRGLCKLQINGVGGYVPGLSRRADVAKGFSVRRGLNPGME